MRTRWLLWTPLVACQVEYGSVAIPDEIIVPANPPDVGTEIVEDVLKQGNPKQVDILWVVDNSSSMLAEQQKLTENFPSFIQYYRNSGLDWQIGVVSTDGHDPDHSGRLQGAAGYTFVDTRTPDPTGVFQQAASLGRDGHAQEEGLAAIQDALSAPLINGKNRGFYRPDALLSIIVVSDENDFSRNLPPDDFEDWMFSLKPDPEMITFSAIVNFDDPCGPGQNGRDYRQMVEATGGAEFDICTNDWTPILEQLGIRTAGLTRTFYLSQFPVEDSLVVWIEDLGEVFEFERGVDYEFDPVSNAIEFTRYTPRSSAEIHVEYELYATK
jgi:hypothetical protein